MHPLALAVAFLTVLLAWSSRTAITDFTGPLRSIPGPFFSRFTRLWYLIRVYLGNVEKDNIELHRKHGRIVRVAPNMYSIDAPDAIHKIYGISSKMPKSDWYSAWKHPSPERWSLFPDRDIKRHAETRRKFQSLYSMTGLLSYETYVDECADILLQRLSELSKQNTTIDMAHWFQCYAFDVIGNITFSKRFGFLDKGEDISGLIKALESAMKYSSLMGIYPVFHKYVYTVMEWLGLGGASGRTYLMGYVRSRMQQRKEEDEKAGDQSVDESAPMDFMEKLSIQSRKDPEKITPYHMFILGLHNVIAGSDTTAVSLSSVLYHLMRNPKTLEVLREEVDKSVSGQHLSFKDSQEMPYLQAVIKEGLRLHPATGFPLWRTVTEGGLTMDDYFFPEGTVLGLNTWVAHYNRDVFGPDAEAFRPERWIETNENAEQLKRMNAYFVPFGLGSRTCLGKHVSLLEMAKLIPLIVKSFDFERQGNQSDWKVLNYWFIKPVDFFVKVRPRKTA